MKALSSLQPVSFLRSKTASTKSSAFALRGGISSKRRRNIIATFVPVAANVPDPNLAMETISKELKSTSRAAMKLELVLLSRIEVGRTMAA